MNPLDELISGKQLSDFCKHWGIAELATFETDTPSEDEITLLVTAQPNAQWTLLDFIGMEYDLNDIAGRKIRLISKQALEEGDNSLRRERVLKSAQVVYAA